MSPITEINPDWIARHPLPRPGDGGKEERGRILVVGGDSDLLGAVRLAGEAALRAGAGKLQVTAPAQAVAALAIALPEARVLAVPQGADAPVDEDLLSSLRRSEASLIGPGMMARHETMARRLAAEVGGVLVLDAAAIEAAGEPRKAKGLILTPHAGEMARLLGIDKGRIEADPLDAARQAAERFGAVVAMKGARTFIAGPDGACAAYAGGGPGLGISGSGDVLAGVIAGLAARGADPFEAAAWGVYLHGEAGRRLGQSVGPLGFLSRELGAEIPSLLAR